MENYIKDYIINDEEINKLKEYDLKSKTYVVDGNHTLLSFIFQFNQLLMLINNPIFFPHLDYVDMFNKDIKEE
ncbi:conserved domain protein [Parvimonas sp. oral taxon 393 str. F0440]|nr:conserved domain protein [Parvimonas sp. oral taxon 393 str. F0440]